MKRHFIALLLAALPLFASAATQEILSATPWKTLKHGGAEGTVTRRQDGSFLLEKSNDKGILFFYNSDSEYPVTPGKIYRFVVEYKGEADMNLMLQFPGGKRTPFPNVKAKDGVAEVAIIAQPDETSARIHLMLNNAAKVTVTRIAVEEVEPGDNLLLNPALNWYKVDVEGGKSTLRKSGGVYTVDANSASGYTAFASGVNLEITPGKHYLVTITAKRHGETVSYRSLFSMPGGKRTPFPSVPSDGSLDEPETMRYLFTARADEKNLRPHLIISGTGKVDLLGLTLKELSDEEFAKEQDAEKITSSEFRGSALKKAWRSTGGTPVGNPKNPFLEITAASQGGITCDNLNWDASQLKSVELDFRTRHEGGYLECRFTSQDDGKTYNAYYGISVLPDGQWHHLMFPVSAEPAWRGKITQLQFIWVGKNTTMAFRDICGRKTVNRITDLRPRGIYRLSRLSGDGAAEIRFLDRQYKEIGKVDLPAGTASREFTVPALAMTAECVPADAPLLAELIDIPKLNHPAAYWKGSWIWCWNGFGPDAQDVWFKKEFDLPELPSEAAFVGAGDDSYEVFLNGTSLGKGSDWTIADKFDALKALKKGKNTLVVRVFNYQAWGGLLCDFYYNLNGKAHYIVSDGSWFCHIGGIKEPAEFERPVMVLGAPPTAPWNNRVGYVYNGPKGKIRILEAGTGEFTAKVLSAPAIDSDKMELALVGADEKKQTVTAIVSPATGKWTTGSEVKVRLSLPPQFAAADVFNRCEFLEVEKDAKLATVEVLPAAARELPEVKVAGTGVRPNFVVNGKNYAPIYFYMSAGFKSRPATRDWMIRNALAAGCSVIRCATSFESFWKGDNSFDFQEIDRILEVLASFAPDGKYIVNIDTGMPNWWLKKYPDDATAYFGGRPRHQQRDRQALASKRYLADARQPLHAFAEHIRNSPYADKVIGVSIGEGWNCEWFWNDRDNNNQRAMGGYSPADHATFRSYLRERYRTDAALQAAWKRPDVTLDNAPMPTDKEWHKSSVGLLLDPEKEMALIDWFRFRNRSIGEAITELCKIVKEESGGRWITGVYYGYWLAFSNIFNKLQTVGHLDMERVARSPYVDFLTAPSFYTWRHAGESDAIMQAAETFSLHGKLIIVEQDLRTYSDPSTYETRNAKVSTPDQSVGAIDRAFALTMTRGVGTHWYEMYETWFTEPLLLSAMNEGQRAYEALPPVQGTTPVEVAIVSDPESAMYTKINAGDGLHVASVGEMQRRFAEAGMTFQQVMLYDLLEKDLVPPQKFYIVNNLLALSGEQRAALMQRFEREKATVLWLYAAGLYENEKGPSVEAMNRFLGISFTMDETKTAPAMTLKPGFGVTTAVNFSNTSPWFHPVSGYQEVIGTLADGKPALVKWQRNGVTHYFSTLMNLPPDLVSVLAEKAGVHIYSRSGDPILVGNDVVALHAKTGGEKSLNLLPGTRMKAILGPIRGEFRSGEKFQTHAGQTYVFHVVRQ